MAAFAALDSAHAQAAEVEARLVDCRSLMMTAILFSRHFAERAAARESELGALEKTLTDISTTVTKKSEAYQLAKKELGLARQAREASDRRQKIAGKEVLAAVDKARRAAKMSSEKKSESRIRSRSRSPYSRRRKSHGHRHSSPLRPQSTRRRRGDARSLSRSRGQRHEGHRHQKSSPKRASSASRSAPHSGSCSVSNSEREDVGSGLKDRAKRRKVGGDKKGGDRGRDPADVRDEDVKTVDDKETGGQANGKNSDHVAKSSSEARNGVSNGSKALEACDSAGGGAKDATCVVAGQSGADLMKGDRSTEADVPASALADVTNDRGVRGVESESLGAVNAGSGLPGSACVDDSPCPSQRDPSGSESDDRASLSHSVSVMRSHSRASGRTSRSGSKSASGKSSTKTRSKSRSTQRTRSSSRSHCSGDSRSSSRSASSVSSLSRSPPRRRRRSRSIARSRSRSLSPAYRGRRRSRRRSRSRSAFRSRRDSHRDDYNARDRRYRSPSRRRYADRAKPDSATRGLFVTALKDLVRKRRLPCNISILNDLMRTRDKTFHVQKRGFPSFSTMCVAFGREGIVDIEHAGQTWLIRSTPYESEARRGAIRRQSRSRRRGRSRSRGHHRSRYSRSPSHHTSVPKGRSRPAKVQSPAARSRSHSSPSPAWAMHNGKGGPSGTEPSQTEAPPAKTSPGMNDRWEME
eukprot:evm.model.scf_575EXC.3 EVM.evm.TU.scf_575EXC.3   scf_575EXC:33008-38563(+)